MNFSHPFPRMPDQPWQPQPAQGGAAADPARETAIRGFYKGYLGRTDAQIDADPGFKQWVNGGTSLDQVEQAILASPESQAFKARGPTITNPRDMKGPPGPLKGHFQDNPDGTKTWVPDTSATTPPGPGGGGPQTFKSSGDPATLGSLFKTFDEPQPNPDDFRFDPSKTPVPTFTPPGIPQAPAFSYGAYEAPKPFQAPTLDEARAMPGYEFARSQGEGAVLNRAFGQGTGRSSGTIKDLLGFNQNFADTNYNNLLGQREGIYNLNAQTGANAYTMNRSNALDTYNTNYGTQYRDPYLASYTAARDVYAPQLAAWQTGQTSGQRQSELDYQRRADEWLNRWNMFDKNRNFIGDTLYRQEALGAGAT